VNKVGSHDLMATLLTLKPEAEERLGTRMHIVFSGATEAHLLAEEIPTLTMSADECLTYGFTTVKAKESSKVGFTNVRASILAGPSTVSLTDTAHAMQRGQTVQKVVALHVASGKPHPLTRITGQISGSVGEQIPTLKRLLFSFEPQETEETVRWFKQAVEVVPLLIEVGGGDMRVTLLKLKAKAEERLGTMLRVVFPGAAEAHLLAEEISKAGVGVILNLTGPYPATWGHRRILAGPPLANDTALLIFTENGVTVAISVPEA